MNKMVKLTVVASWDVTPLSNNSTFSLSHTSGVSSHCKSNSNISQTSEQQYHRLEPCVRQV